MRNLISLFLTRRLKYSSGYAEKWFVISVDVFTLYAYIYQLYMPVYLLDWQDTFARARDVHSIRHYYLSIGIQHCKLKIKLMPRGKRFPAARSSVRRALPRLRVATCPRAPKSTIANDGEKPSQTTHFIQMIYYGRTTNVPWTSPGDLCYVGALTYRVRGAAEEEAR